MTRDEFLRDLEDMMEVTSGSLTGNEALRDLEEWDSMQMLSFMAMVNDRFGFVLEGAAVNTTTTVDDLLNLVDDHFTA